MVVPKWGINTQVLMCLWCLILGLSIGAYYGVPFKFEELISAFSAIAAIAAAYAAFLSWRVSHETRRDAHHARLHAGLISAAHDLVDLTEEHISLGNYLDDLINPKLAESAMGAMRKPTGERLARLTQLQEDNADISNTLAHCSREMHRAGKLEDVRRSQLAVVMSKGFHKRAASELQRLGYNK